MSFQPEKSLRMSVMIKEVYEAFKAANVDHEIASAAAEAIPGKENLATKEDMANLRQEMLRLENRILLWMGGMFIVAVGVLGLLMKFFQAGATP